MSESIRHHIKTLRQRDMVLFTVSAILLPDTLAAAASSGAVEHQLVADPRRAVPAALRADSAELGCSYPEQGGIYAWVRDAFGGRWASRITWCYWINCRVAAGDLHPLRRHLQPGLRLNLSASGFQIGLAIALTWPRWRERRRPCAVGKWIPNIGAMVKILLFAAIILGAWRYVSPARHGQPLTLDTMTPRWGEGLQYIPAIIYGMLGFELVSAGAEEMRDPARDVPRSILSRGHRDRALPARHRGRPRRRARGGDQPRRGPHRHPAHVLLGPGCRLWR
jgi:hypothetical protein